MARSGRGAAPFLVLLALMAAQCFHQSTEAKEVTTNLHFFFHDTLSGPDPSAVLIASAPGSTGFGSFGDFFAVDDPLTEGPEVDSPVVGYARGFYMLASRKSPVLVMGLDYGFTAGPFNGSSFSVFSQNSILTDGDREVTVVGGRGKFRMAQGFALLRTHSANATSGDAVVEYNVTLFHHE